jgi:haloalkane dehalogenase
MMIPVLVDNGYRVIVPDLAGFGKSDKPKDPSYYSLSKHVDIVGRLLNVLEMRNIVLFGQDWGSMIGLRLAAKNQDKFSGIIISNGGLPDGRTKPPFRFLLWKYFALFSPWLPVGFILDLGCIRKLTPETRKAYRAPFPTRQSKISIRTMPKLVPVKEWTTEADLNRETHDLLKAWEKPFLTVFGSADPITRGWDKKLVQDIPGSREQNHSLLRAGHFIQEDTPIELAQIIITFIREKIM